MILFGLIPTSCLSQTLWCQEPCTILSYLCCSCQSSCVHGLYLVRKGCCCLVHHGMIFFLISHSLWCRKEKYEKVSECLHIIRLESKYDRNPSFIIKSQNKYDQNPILWWCHDFSSWCLLPMLWSIHFNILIDTTFLCVYRYQRYDRSCLFKPTLRSVWLIWNNVTIGVLDFNRRYNQCSRLQPTIDVIDLCPCYRRYDRYSRFVTPFYLLILIVRSKYRMLVVFIHNTIFF